jgi:hypothetical protein
VTVKVAEREGEKVLTFDATITKPAEPEPVGAAPA